MISTLPSAVRRTIAVAAGLGIAATLGACSVSVNKTASAEKVATTAEDALEEKYGQRPEIECPDSIALKTDETMRCTLTDPSSGAEYGMTVLVKDDEGNLSFEVDDEPEGGATDDTSDETTESDDATDDTTGDKPETISASDVALSAEDTLEQSVGQRPEVECPDEIVYTTGETLRCTLTDPSSGTEYGMTVTVEDEAPDGSGLYFQVDDQPMS